MATRNEFEQWALDSGWRDDGAGNLIRVLPTASGLRRCRLRFSIVQAVRLEVEEMGQWVRWRTWFLHELHPVIRDVLMIETSN